MRLDLHVHSVHSPDSGLSLEAIVAQLGAAGLQGFALTDHNSIAGHARLRELARSAPGSLLVPGVEVSTHDGHLLVYGVEELPPLRRPLPETLDWVRGRGGVAVIAHPYRWAHGAGDALARTARADGIEAMNGHNRPVANARAELVAAQRGLAGTGGSDAHRLADLGRVYTEFGEPAESVDDLLRLLRSGRGHAGGTALPVISRVALSVRTALLRARRGFRSI